jgi:NAD(P)-dependent dehydrogenase (short-subunit alcohol dehydrogenase family)
VNTVSELLDLRGRSALVSGGSGGIGRAIVRRLIEQGARVVVVDRPDSAFPEGSIAWPADLTDAQAIGGLSERIASLVDPVDMFVHCAGITRDGVLWKLSATDWRDVQSVNLDAAFHLMQLVIPSMRLTAC